MHAGASLIGRAMRRDRDACRDDFHAMRAGMRDPRVRGVAWRDLVALKPVEVVAELLIWAPWLALSLVFADQRLYLPALLCSFMMFLTGLRQSHNAQHHALGLGRGATATVLFVLSIVMLGSMHAIKFNHLRHHKHCMTGADVEGKSARMSGLQAVAFGPLFPVLLHRTALRDGNRRMRRWMLAELAANLVWIALVFGWFDVECLRYHVAVMGVAQCLTAFFAVWTVHNHCSERLFPARTQRGRLKNLVTYNMFYHAEHHLFPQVPTCHLPALARRLDGTVPELRTAPVF